MCKTSAGARRWRPALVAQVAPANDDVIADIGCGTGTQLCLIARACRSATLIGIDPDAAVRRRARAKLAQGILPELMTDVGFHSVEETHVFETLSGSVSIYRAVLP